MKKLRLSVIFTVWWKLVLQINVTNQKIRYEWYSKVYFHWINKLTKRLKCFIKVHKRFHVDAYSYIKFDIRPVIFLFMSAIHQFRLYKQYSFNRSIFTKCLHKHKRRAVNLNLNSILNLLLKVYTAAKLVNHFKVLTYNTVKYNP